MLTEQENLNELIALDLLTTYVKRTLDEIGEAASQVNAAKSRESVRDFEKGLASAQAALQQVELKNKNRADLAMRLIDRTRYIEGILAQQFHGRLAAGVPATGG